jgi:hypothetical protein
MHKDNAMRYITQPMLVNAINAQGSLFVSHDIIRFLYTNYQHQYLSELNSHSTASLPFTETHRQIGLALSRLPMIHKTTRVPSEKTMRGKRTLVQEWRR